jgi:hypothetical protein
MELYATGVTRFVYSRHRFRAPLPFYIKIKTNTKEIEIMTNQVSQYETQIQN